MAHNPPIPAHKPNPFDFVPFPQEPLLYAPEALDAMGPHLSGYLEVTVRTIAPVHVAGAVTREQEAGHSRMYRQDGRPCIPGSTIRGCLRAFIEALTAGWVSQANEAYVKEHGKRHIGFKTFDSARNVSASGLIYDAPAAIHPDFQPAVRPDGKIDVASYLFGIVLEKGRTKETPHAALARRGKVLVEDAFVDEALLRRDVDWAPDLGPVDVEAFMGGGKPSASNWWYLTPSMVRERVLPNGFELAEFVGAQFRGRKFYYHQPWRRCLHEYEENWPFTEENPLYQVWLECLPQRQTTEVFRIYVDDIPRSLLVLLIVALCPGRYMRHKIGYAKAYGYGSVQFSLQGAMLRQERDAPALPDRLQDGLVPVQEWTRHRWQERFLSEHGLTELIDWSALAWLARILGTQNVNNVVYLYPPYTAHYFEQPVSRRDLNDRLPGMLPHHGSIAIDDPGRVTAIVRQLSALKLPIDFRHYQLTAAQWRDCVWPRTP